jgi:hypothetical protein
MPPLLLELSSSGTLSSLISFAPSLEVPRGYADRLLSNTPHPIVNSFGVEKKPIPRGRPASLEPRTLQVNKRTWQLTM